MDKSKDHLLLLLNVDDQTLLQLLPVTPAARRCTYCICLVDPTPAASPDTPKQPSIDRPAAFLQAKCVPPTDKPDHLQRVRGVGQEPQPGLSLPGHTVPVVLLAHRLARLEVAWCWLLCSTIWLVVALLGLVGWGVSGVDMSLEKFRDLQLDYTCFDLNECISLLVAIL